MHGCRRSTSSSPSGARRCSRRWQAFLIRSRWPVAPGTWSVATILDHLRLTESSVSKLLHVTVSRLPADGRLQETETDSVLHRWIMPVSPIATLVGSPPPMVQPRPTSFSPMRWPTSRRLAPRCGVDAGGRRSCLGELQLSPSDARPTRSLSSACVRRPARVTARLPDSELGKHVFDPDPRRRPLTSFLSFISRHRS